MTTLDAVTLPTGMVWEDRNKWQPVRQETKLTLGGSQVVYSAALQSGRPVTLVAYSDQGWLTKEQVEQVEALAATPGATYTLTLGAESFTVCFRHHEAPAVEMSPLIPRGVPVTGDWYVGTIKLMVV